MDYYHQYWLTSVNGPARNLLLQLFTAGSSKMEVFKTFFLIPGLP